MWGRGPLPLSGQRKRSLRGPGPPPRRRDRLPLCGLGDGGRGLPGRLRDRGDAAGRSTARRRAQPELRARAAEGAGPMKVLVFFPFDEAQMAGLRAAAHGAEVLQARTEEEALRLVADADA